MKIISCQEADRKRLKRYFTGKPCPHGHIAERYVKGRGCVACKDIGVKAYRRGEKPNRDQPAPKKSKVNKAKPQLTNIQRLALGLSVRN